MSERIAFYCNHRDHEKPNPGAYRIFLLPGEPMPPRCKDHPERKMIRQENQPYMTGRTGFRSKARS
jgi:hypothetical protein